MQSLLCTIHITSHHTQTCTEKHVIKEYQKPITTVSHHLEFGQQARIHHSITETVCSVLGRAIVQTSQNSQDFI